MAWFEPLPCWAIVKLPKSTNDFLRECKVVMMVLNVRTDMESRQSDRDFVVLATTRATEHADEKISSKKGRSIADVFSM